MFFATTSKAMKYKLLEYRYLQSVLQKGLSSLAGTRTGDVPPI